MKFETKLQPTRLFKYYFRGYNIISPLYLRVHGHGSLSKQYIIIHIVLLMLTSLILDSEEKITRDVHPTTFQMLELMKLVKVVLMQMIHNKPKYEYSLGSGTH